MPALVRHLTGLGRRHREEVALKLAGLAGGIGCGKSTVAALLAQRGAVVIDVDVLSRELQQPGRPVFEAMVQRWGPAILTEDGALHRQAVAELVFADRTEMEALMAMTSPAIEEALCARASAYHGTGRVVLLEAALLVGSPRRYGITGLVVVDAPQEVALHRLVSGRAMSEQDARARLGSQPPRAARLQAADYVVDNAGPLETLDRQVEGTWAWLLSLPDGQFRRPA